MRVGQKYPGYKKVQVVGRIQREKVPEYCNNKRSAQPLKVRAPSPKVKLDALWETWMRDRKPFRARPISDSEAVHRGPEDHILTTENGALQLSQ